MLQALCVLNACLVVSMLKVTSCVKKVNETTACKHKRQNQINTKITRVISSKQSPAVIMMIIIIMMMISLKEIMLADV